MGRRKKYSKDDCLKVLQVLTKHLAGEVRQIPLDAGDYKMEWIEEELNELGVDTSNWTRLPSAVVFQQRFGGLNNAKKEAGVDNALELYDWENMRGREKVEQAEKILKDFNTLKFEISWDGQLGSILRHGELRMTSNNLSKVVAEMNEIIKQHFTLRDLIVLDSRLGLKVMHQVNKRIQKIRGDVA